MTFTFNTTDTPQYIQTGKIYRIQFWAENIVGLSYDKDYELIIGISEDP